VRLVSVRFIDISIVGFCVTGSAALNPISDTPKAAVFWQA
jgi:hypothetical protein